MFSATRMLSGVKEDVLRRAYWVALVLLDRYISEIETAIYWRASRIHGSISATDTAIHSANYADPLALARNAFLQQRNEIAPLCSVKRRRIHDISEDALGYMPFGNSYAVIVGGGLIQPLSWAVGV